MKHIAKLLTAILALILLLCACGGDPNTTEQTTTASEDIAASTSETTTATTEAPAPTGLEIIKNGESTYQLIRPEEGSSALIKSASNLLTTIKEKTGKLLKMGSDWYSDRNGTPDLSGPEILIGGTNRAETAEVLAALPENSYTVTIKNNKLVIVGKDNNLTALALFAFEERILNNAACCADGTLTVTENDSFTVTLDSPFTMKTLLKGKYEYLCTSKKVVQTDRQGDYRIGQGSASDGTYVYFVLRNNNDTGSVVTKHRLDDGSFVAVSGVLDLGHGNDATFDTVNNRLVIAHGQSEGKILTLVNPDTLELIKDINIPAGSGAITYSVAQNKYAISQGGSTLHFLDADFKHISSHARTDKTGYTAQGMGSDEDYIYFPMSGSKDNKLVVYDWNAKYVTTLTVPVDHESESMFWVNGRYYIAYNTAGEALYETVFEVVYQ